VWKRFAKTSIRVNRMSVSFTLNVYMSKWTSFIDILLKERAETQAALFFERAQRKSRIFSAWMHQTKRSIRLRKASGKLGNVRIGREQRTAGAKRQQQHQLHNYALLPYTT